MLEFKQLFRIFKARCSIDTGILIKDIKAFFQITLEFYQMTLAFPQMTLGISTNDTLAFRQIILWHFSK
jgi:hypothetical protein